MGKPKASATKNTTPKRVPRGGPDWALKFIVALARNGVVTHAAKASGVSLRVAYNLRSSDEEFAKFWDEAIAASVENAEAALYERGVYGLEKPVYQGGLQVGTVREYDTTALIFYLKAANRAKYGEPKGDIHIHQEAKPLSPAVASASIAAGKAAHEAEQAKLASES